MVSAIEIGANAGNVIAIVLAARNSVHTWWTGIVSCALFAWVFYETQLYADVTLQAFFIVSSLVGWWHWLHGRGGTLPVRRTGLPQLVACTVAAALAALGYGLLLQHYTRAFAPFFDSIVLAFSVLGQLLMMGRRIENWHAWLVVNSVAAPLYAVRGLYVTAALYLFFWFNTWYGLHRWRRELAA
ncbi:MAG TPA: nicotinamide riboside transporter PnuC [Noviherbaspirillum sp.]